MLGIIIVEWGAYLRPTGEGDNMEERFDEMICPNCGKEMGKGISPHTWRPYLYWIPGREAPSVKTLYKLRDARDCEDSSKGVVFCGSADLWKNSYYPSWYCHECGLLLIDTKVQLER